MTRVSLAGGEGFIGRNAIEALQTDHSVTSIDFKPSPFYKSDYELIVSDPYKIKIPITGEIFIHLIDHQLSSKDFSAGEHDLAKNVSLDTYKHVILISSSIVLANPNTQYGQRKIILEKFYSNFCSRHDIPLTIVRVFNVYGKYQKPHVAGGLAATLIIDALKETVTEITDLDARRDFIYAGDIGKIIRWIITQKSAGTIDAGTGTLRTVRDLITLIDNLIAPRRCLIADTHKKDTIAVRADGRINSHFGLTKIEDALRETVNFYENNFRHFA